jgi:hypothetical protein
MPQATNSIAFPPNRKEWAVRLTLIVAILGLIAGCASRPKSPISDSVAPVLSDALSLKGTPYVWGGESPDEGFDCSGFVQYVYGRHGIALPRTARQMAESLTPLSDDNPRPGDLVFFNTTGQPYSHVGIYLGRNSFVHASSAKGGVIVSSLDQPYWTEHFLGHRRPSRMTPSYKAADSSLADYSGRGRWFR